MGETRALVDEAGYQEMYRQSVDNPEEFWGEHGKRIDWITPYTEVKDVSYDHDDVHIRWYHDGTLNASVNCLDRHLEKRGDQVAIIWEGDEPSDSKTLTYRELYEEVCKFSNVLKDNGVKKGDRVTIYLPMVPEIAVAVLACARVGAIHSVIFGGFSPDLNRRAYSRFRFHNYRHGRRRRARRPADPAKRQCRRSAETMSDDREMHRRQTHG